jgi:hypothetical protein
MSHAEDRSNVAKWWEKARQDIRPTSVPFLQAISTVNGAPAELPPSVHGEASVSRHAKRKYAVNCSCLLSTKL